MADKLWYLVNAATQERVPVKLVDIGGGLYAQAVAGPLTDTQLRATAVPVSGTVTASGPLTDTQLRATAVPVSGTVTASGPLTDTQLRAADVKMSLDGEEVQGKRVASGTYASAVSVLSTATAIIAANANRIGVEVHHQGTATARVWLGADNTLTAGATGKNFGYLDPGDTWERRDYTGAVYGRTEAGTAYVSSLEV
jgi:hypothetical protein